MFDLSKWYFLSGGFFIDLLFVVCVYFSFYIYIPYLFISIVSGEIKSKSGTFGLRTQPFRYVLFIFGNLVLFANLLMGGIMIGMYRYLGV